MSALEVIVIDYGVGNLLSVQRGLEYCGAKVTLTADPEKILAAKRVVLPGVGAFSNAMQALESLGLVAVLRELAHRGTFLLGICLGMQLLLDESEEFGNTVGLGLVPGRVVPVPSRTVSGEMQKIPHIGWSALQPTASPGRWSGTLLQDICPEESTYFVHSFMAVPVYSMHCIAYCEYGGHIIPAVIRKNHITGCQFHPEKSGEVGLKVLRSFLNL
ncbi:MAG: imidazole glycerol phosphate synthase subunit HisH [Desulfobulbaceae bacterium]|nr:imidazole glycerol phosphate synthase subunit HisH [Desulfobulbaceae bacterium]